MAAFTGLVDGRSHPQRFAGISIVPISGKAMPRRFHLAVPAVALTALLFVAGCKVFPDKQSYAEQIARIPAPVNESEWQVQCNLLRDELAKQKYLVSLGATRDNIAVVESRQSDFHCASGFVRATPPGPTPTTTPDAAASPENHESSPLPLHRDSDASSASAVAQEHDLHKTHHEFYELVCNSSTSKLHELKFHIDVSADGYVSVSATDSADKAQHEVAVYTNAFVWREAGDEYFVDRFNGVLTIKPEARSYLCEKVGGRKF
jgi:hypothetical protein